MKDGFYFMFKAPFILKILNFSPGFLVKHFIRAIKLMTSYTGKRIITIDILSIISRSKDNQEMKFGLSIKHKITYIFL